MVDIYDAEGSVTVLADMPGVTSENVEVRVDGRRLSVRGRPGTVEQVGRSHVAERRRGDYARVFALGEAVDTETITAELKGGVLKLILAKRVEDKTPKTITVKTS